MLIVFNLIETLRALYLGDNDFEFIPPGIGNLKNLQIVSEYFPYISMHSIFNLDFDLLIL